MTFFCLRPSPTIEVELEGPTILDKELIEVLCGKKINQSERDRSLLRTRKKNKKVEPINPHVLKNISYLIKHLAKFKIEARFNYSRMTLVCKGPRKALFRKHGEPFTEDKTVEQSLSGSSTYRELSTSPNGLFEPHLLIKIRGDILTHAGKRIGYEFDYYPIGTSQKTISLGVGLPYPTSKLSFFKVKMKAEDISISNIVVAEDGRQNPELEIKLNISSVFKTVSVETAMNLVMKLLGASTCNLGKTNEIPELIDALMKFGSYGATVYPKRIVLLREDLEGNKSCALIYCYRPGYVFRNVVQIQICSSFLTKAQKKFLAEKILESFIYKPILNEEQANKLLISLGFKCRTTRYKVLWEPIEIKQSLNKVVEKPCVAKILLVCKEVQISNLNGPCIFINFDAPTLALTELSRKFLPIGIPYDQQKLETMFGILNNIFGYRPNVTTQLVSNEIKFIIHGKPSPPWYEFVNLQGGTPIANLKQDMLTLRFFRVHFSISRWQIIQKYLGILGSFSFYPSVVFGISNMEKTGINLESSFRLITRNIEYQLSFSLPVSLTRLFDLVLNNPKNLISPSVSLSANWPLVQGKSNYSVTGTLNYGSETEMSAIKIPASFQEASLKGLYLPLSINGNHVLSDNYKKKSLDWEFKVLSGLHNGIFKGTNFGLTYNHMEIYQDKNTELTVHGVTSVGASSSAALPDQVRLRLILLPMEDLVSSGVIFRWIVYKELADSSAIFGVKLINLAAGFFLNGGILGTLNHRTLETINTILAYQSWFGSRALNLVCSFGLVFMITVMGIMVFFMGVGLKFIHGTMSFDIDFGLIVNVSPIKIRYEQKKIMGGVE